MSSDARARVSPAAGAWFPTFRAWIGNLGWPILLRQLRADFRKNRFFLTQWLCLCALGLALIVMISSKVSKQETAVQVGRSLFDTFFILEYAIIAVIFPAFSATAFAEERSNLTIDLLLTTNLKPAELVWGKLLASTIGCLMYVLASIPLLSIAFLFGGVPLGEVLFAYGLLVGLTLFVSMLGVCVSSWYTSTIRASFTMYVFVFIGLGFSYLVYQELAKRMEKDSSLTLIGALRDHLGFGGSLGAVDALAFFFLPAVAFAYLFLITANRIRPAADDRATGLRALTFVAILGLLAWRAWSALRGASGPVREEFLKVVQLAALLLFAAALVFPAEEARVSRRNRLRFGKWTGVRYAFRILAPGAFWGFVYTAVLTLIACGGLWWAWSAFAGRPGEATALVEDYLGTLAPYVIAFAGLGFLLAAADFTPLYARLTVFFLFIITLLLPVIFMLSKVKDAWWTFYYLSPITLWYSLQESLTEQDPKFTLFGFRDLDVAKVVFSALAIAFLAAGMWLARSAGHPLFRFGPGPEPAQQRKPRRLTAAAAAKAGS